MTTKVTTAFHFQCPIHGSEFHAFCPEALKEENRDRWTKYNVIYVLTDHTDEELDKFIESIRNSKLVAHEVEA